MVFVKKANQKQIIKSFQFLIQTIDDLIGKSDQPSLLTDTENYDLGAAVYNKLSIELYSVLKCELYCIFERPAEAYRQYIDDSKLINKSEMFSVTTYLLPLYQFYMGLNLLSMYDLSSQKEKNYIKKTVAASLKMMEKKWIAILSC